MNRIVLINSIITIIANNYSMLKNTEKSIRKANSKCNKSKVYANNNNANFVLDYLTFYNLE